MGLVYAAVDERLDRPIALKIIHGDTADNDVARERFWREARLAASVNHAVKQGKTRHRKLTRRNTAAEAYGRSDLVAVRRHPA